MKIELATTALSLQHFLANRWSSLFPVSFGHSGSYVVLSPPEHATWEDICWLREGFQDGVRNRFLQREGLPFHYLWTLESKLADPFFSPASGIPLNLHFNYVSSLPLYPDFVGPLWSRLLEKRFSAVRVPHALHHTKRLENPYLLSYIFKETTSFHAQRLRDHFGLAQEPRLWGLSRPLREIIHPLLHPPLPASDLCRFQEGRELLMIDSGLEQLDPTEVSNAGYQYFQSVYARCHERFLALLRDYRVTKRHKQWEKRLKTVLEQPLPALGDTRLERWCLLTLLTFVGAPYLQWDLIRSTAKLGRLLLAQVYCVALPGSSPHWEKLVEMGQDLALCSRELLNECQSLFRVSSYRSELKLEFLEAGTAFSQKFHDNQYRLGAALSRGPMVCPPNPWSTPIDLTNAADNCSGGYLFNGKKFQIPLVRSVGRPNNYQASAPILSGGEFLEAINRLQQFPYSLNRNLYDYYRQVVWPVYQEAWREEKRTCRCLEVELVGLRAEEKPPYPNSEKIRELRASLDDSHSRLGYYEQLERLWPQVESFFDQKLDLYFPYRADFRGRLYALPDFFNPVSSKISRFLVQTAEPYAWNDRCLTIFKHSMHRAWSSDRLSPEEHLLCFEKELAPHFLAAENGRWRYDSPFLWEKAREKEAFLAHCFEWERYTAWRRANPDAPAEVYRSHFIVFLDSSCSGLQHLSLFLDFSDLWDQLNLSPRKDSEKLGDAYLEIGTQFLEFLQRDHREIWDQLPLSLQRSFTCSPPSPEIRKLFKLPVMTLCYGATVLTISNQFQNQLRKIKQVSDEAKLQKYRYRGAEYPLGSVFAYLFHPFLESRYPQLSQFLELASQTGRLFAAEDSPIPLSAAYCGGLMAFQQYRVSKRAVLDHKPAESKGKRVQMTITRRTSKPALVKSSHSLAANVVHFLDALLVRRLLLAAPPELEAFLSIHDCWGVPLHRVDWLREEVSRQLVTVYGGSDRPLVLSLLEEWLRQLQSDSAVQLLEPFLARFQSRSDRSDRLGKLEISRDPVSL